jgi:hypothetical protein
MNCSLILNPQILHAGYSMKISVECYSGYRGEETPRRFWIGERQLEIKEVLDRWLAPEHRYFKVMAEDNSIYILRHDSQCHTWELSFYKRQEMK